MVSADELNERFDNLEQQLRDFVAADLVGAWSCPLIARYSSVSYTGWTVSADGLTQSTAITLTFTQSSGTLYLSSTSAPSGYGCAACGLTNLPIQIYGGIGLRADNLPSYLYNGSINWPIRKRSNTRFEFSGIPSVVAAAICDKQNVPPLKPSNLTAAASGTSISLTWTDNSADETGFDIVRKDTASGSWSVVGSVAANVVTYVNTSVAAGTHWYRVVAKNANGSSLGSNVVKVTN